MKKRFQLLCALLALASLTWQAIPQVALPQPPTRSLDPAALDLIATEVGLSEAIATAADLLAGKVRGRVVVDVNR